MTTKNAAQRSADRRVAGRPLQVAQPVLMTDRRQCSDWMNAAQKR
jgi:hypothetical protein